MRLSIIAVAAVLAACTVPEEGEDRNEMTAAQSNAAAPVENEVAPEPGRTEPVETPKAGPGRVKPLGPPLESADECGASNYQHLVGQPRSSVPEPPDGARWRIACTSCPVTMDYSPARMNIFYDAETEIIDEVKCG